MGSRGDRFGTVRRTVVLALLACAGCRTQVLSGLSETQANEVVVALDAAHIAASTRRDPSGGRAELAVEVPSAEVIAALRVLHERALPRREPPGLDALERSAGLVPTPAEERARVAHATAGELSRTLSRLPGVREARVHVALPEEATRLDAAPAAPKAAVLLLREPGARPSDEAQVRRLVAAAVDGLAVDAITVEQSEAAAKPPRARSVVQVGPISVERRSAGWLRAVLGATLAANVLLAVALVVLIAQRRRTAPQPPPR